MKGILDDRQYQEMFQEAYGREMNYEDLGRAIGAFERTLVFVDSPFRRFLAGDDQAASADARAGFELFNGKARCAACHPMSPSNPLGTDNRFHNVGVSARHQDFEALGRQAIKLLQEDPSEQRLDELAVGTDMSELGRFMVTRNRVDMGSFRTPLILNIGITPPYMHDGSLATLWDVMDHYNKGGEANPFLDGGIEPLALSEEEIDQLVAFLFTLTDVRFAEENQRQLEQQQAAPQSFAPVSVAEDAESSDANPAFRFAYISDSHLYEKQINDRFVRGLLRAVDDVNNLDPHPDFVFYGGDLAQLGQPKELDLGAEILKNLKAPP